MIKEKGNKQVHFIFLFLGIFSFAMGIWENYKSVWLEINNVSIANISYILSGSLVITCFIAILCASCFKKITTLNIVRFFIFVKIIAMICLAICFNSQNNGLIVVSFALDSIAGNMIIFSIYPLITQTIKDIKIYSKRKLLEYTCLDVGMIVAGGILAFSLAHNFQYNILLISSILLTAFSIPLLFFIKNVHSEKTFSFKRIFKDKIVNLYQVYYFVAQIAFCSSLGMMALLLKNILGLSMNWVTLFIVFSSIFGDIFGYLALWKLQPKNDYVTFSLKFWMRFFVYLLIVITGNIYVALVSIFLSLFVSRAYEDVSDGVYINRINSEDQLGFANIRYSVGKFGAAIGTFLCGAMFDFGLRAIFGVSCIFILISNLLGFYLIHLRNKEKKLLQDQK